MKVFVLSGKCGICYDILTYQGKYTKFDEYRQFGLGAAVGLRSSQRIGEQYGHTLYFDTYFSSYQLFQILKQNKIAAASTVRINRFFKPSLICDKDLKKKERGYSDEIISADGDVIFTKWLDDRPVVLASNFVGIGGQDNVRRWDKKSSSYVSVTRPNVVRQYNRECVE